MAYLISLPFNDDFSSVVQFNVMHLLLPFVFIRLESPKSKIKRFGELSHTKLLILCGDTSGRLAFTMSDPADSPLGDFAGTIGGTCGI